MVTVNAWKATTLCMRGTEGNSQKAVVLRHSAGNATECLIWHSEGGNTKGQLLVAVMSSSMRQKGVTRKGSDQG